MQVSSRGDGDRDREGLRADDGEEQSSGSIAREPVNEDEQIQGDEEAGRQLEPGVKELEADEPATASSKALRHTSILALLAFASIWGTLTREGLVALNTYSGMSITPTIWAQSFGCLVMGWTVANRQALETRYPPVYIAIGTGYCGSVTTFSTWILEIFEAFGNKNHYNRHGLHNVMDAFTQTAATIGMSLISVSAGMSLAHVLPARPLLHRLERMTVLKRRKKVSDEETPGAVFSSVTFDIISIVNGVLFWTASAILCGTYAPFRQVTFALVLSPPGAILRWYLSRLNSIPRSTRFPYWPMGTLSANLLATVVIAAVYVGQNVGRVAGRGGGGAYTVNSCHALYGLQQGFCGCLSTISTFAVELRSMKPRRRGFGYVAGSWVIGLIICVLVIGAPWWTIGMDGSCKGITL